MLEGRIGLNARLRRGVTSNRREMHSAATFRHNESARGRPGRLAEFNDRRRVIYINGKCWVGDLREG